MATDAAFLHQLPLRITKERLALDLGELMISNVLARTGSFFENGQRLALEFVLRPAIFPPGVFAVESHLKARFHFADALAEIDRKRRLRRHGVLLQEIMVRHRRLVAIDTVDDLVVV